MRLGTFSALFAVLCLGFSLPASAQDATRRLDLRFENDGTVTLYALNVSVREVMAEWARQCGCTVVNADGLTGRIDVPTEFDHKPQKSVLESVLREAAGYALTPRRTETVGRSEFDTIFVLPTSRVSQASYVPPPPPQPAYVPPMPSGPEDEIPPVVPVPTLPEPATQTEAPAPAPAPEPPRSSPGVPSRFVPIVPVGGGPSAPGAGTVPGAPTPAPQPGGAPSSDRDVRP